MYRRILGFERFPEYLEYMKILHPKKDLHHLLGSTMGKKFTDALIVPVLHRHHIEEVEPNKAKYFVVYLPQSVRSFQVYCVTQLGFTYQEVSIADSLEPEPINELIKLAKGKENDF